MTLLLSRSQESDFVRQEGLQKLTNVAAYDWDLYILKELVDNALDADESDPHLGAPQVHVRMSYDTVRIASSKRTERSLFIEVNNQARFPLEHIAELFDLRQRVSVKDYHKYPTRGAQGNALKTILGIPYALRYRSWSDYNLDRVPLSISFNKERVVLELEVDQLQQSIGLKSEMLHDGEDMEGTTIAVNIDRFLQRPPRTITQLLDMAETIALFNPHATFHFEFAFTNLDGNGEFEEREFPGDPTWQGKYNQQQKSPIFWYRQDKFQELSFALVRAEATPNTCTLYDLANEFGIQQLPDHHEFRSHTYLRDVIGQASSLAKLYVFLRNCSDKKRIHLGNIGEEHLLRRSEIPMPGDGSVPLFFYHHYFTDKPEDENPFMLEVVLCANGNGKRQIRTGINHTPTYTDPFFNKPLEPPDAEEPVRSLEKLLDYYDLDENIAVTLIVHLITPNIEYENYGKNAISDEPYRAALTKLVDEVVQKYREATRSPDPIDYLTEPTTRILPDLIKSLEEVEFSLSQLLNELRRQLLALNEPDIISDLQNTDANSRLEFVVNNYQRNNEISGLIRRQSGRLALPLYPADIVHIAFANRNILDIVREFHVRAIVITSNPGIEDILIASRYPLRYDVAILRSDGNLSSALDLLINKYQIALSDINPEDDILLPHLWLVRDATLEAIQQTRLTILEHFRKANIEFDRIYDLGLTPSDASDFAMLEYKGATEHQPLDRIALHQQGYTPAEIQLFVEEGASARLESISPLELKEWFESKLDNRNIQRKALPHPQNLASIATTELRHRFRSIIAEIAFETFDLDETQQDLVDLWRADKPDWDTELYTQLQTLLKTNPTESWFGGLQEKLTELVRNYLTPQLRQKIKGMMRE